MLVVVCNCLPGQVIIQTPPFWVTVWDGPSQLLTDCLVFLTPSQLPEGKKSVWKECQAYTVQMIELSMPTNTNTSQHHYSCRVTWYQVTSIHYLYQVTTEPWLTGYSQTDHNEQLKRNFMSFSSHKLTICTHGIVNSQTETAIWDRCKYCSRFEVRNDIFS